MKKVKDGLTLKVREIKKEQHMTVKETDLVVIKDLLIEKGSAGSDESGVIGG